MTQEQLDLYTLNIIREATIIKNELKAMKTKQDLLQVGQRVKVLNLSVITLMDIQAKDWENTMNPHLVPSLAEEDEQALQDDIKDDIANGKIDFNPEYDITNEV